MTLFKTLSLCLTLFRHHLWPDPFRFYAPVTHGLGKRLILAYSPFLKNILFMQQGIAGVQVQGHAHLKDFLTQSANAPRMIVSNHNNFTDPQLLQHWQYTYAPYSTAWIAGVEPMEKLGGRWTMTGNGTFSVDRGILDRPSLQYAQHVLQQGKQPLVIFPEGEALYRHQQLATCQPGAAQLLMKAAKKHCEPAAWLPMNLQYRCWQRDPDHYAKHYRKAARQLQRQWPLNPGVEWPSETPMTEQARLLIELGVAMVWQQHFPTMPLPQGLETQVKTLLHNLIQQLASEHEQEITLPEIHDLDGVMMVKNRLRSAIVRKLRVPNAAWLQHYQTWLKATPEVRNKADRWLLNSMELACFGQLSDKSEIERRTKLTQHLARLLPLATARETQTPETFTRWHTQLNVCRQLKLLAVVLDDYNHPLTLPEDWDNTLYKVRLMVTHRHHYTGPKTAIMTIGEPKTVENGTSADELHQVMVHTLAEMMAPQP